ncbi:substrate-binding domain-containing protein [Streptomyces sp. NPDC001833]|uniref:substrate-binding domain-containing protein n=1 Tax=Streptomyces sp. NPDC001833 TaxID=3154658 RepID=UPI0033199BD0
MRSTRARANALLSARLLWKSDPFAAEQDAVSRLLDHDPSPDAVVGVYSDSGHNILAAARRHGLRVPRDLLVACAARIRTMPRPPRPSPRSASARTGWVPKRSTC